MSRNKYQEDMWVLIEGEGPFVVVVRSEDEASLLGSYWNAVQKYLDTGDWGDLVDFEGESVGGFELETNPAEVDYWARSGEIDFKDIYAVTSNG